MATCHTRAENAGERIRFSLYIDFYKVIFISDSFSTLGYKVSTTTVALLVGSIDQYECEVVVRDACKHKEEESCGENMKIAQTATHHFERLLYSKRSVSDEKSDICRMVWPAPANYFKSPLHCDAKQLPNDKMTFSLDILLRARKDVL